MTLTADSRGRIASLELFPPGTSFEPEVEGTRIILKRLVPEEPKRVFGKLVRRNGRLMLDVPGEITAEAIAKASPRGTRFAGMKKYYWDSSAMINAAVSEQWRSASMWTLTWLAPITCQSSLRL